MHAHRAVTTKLSINGTRLQLAGPVDKEWHRTITVVSQHGRDQLSDSRDNLTHFVSLMSSKQCQILPLWRSSFYPAETAYLKSNTTTHLHPYTRPVIIGRDRLAVREDPISNPARQRAQCDRDVVITVGSKRKSIGATVTVLRACTSRCCCTVRPRLRGPVQYSAPLELCCCILGIFPTFLSMPLGATSHQPILIKGFVSDQKST